MAGRAGDHELAAPVVDDLGGLQAGAALMNDGVAPQHQRVAAKGMDVGVGGVPEAFLSIRNGADLFRRGERSFRGARVRRGGCAGIGVGIPGRRRDRRQEQEPGEMSPPDRPHRRLPPERWRYTSNRAIPAATEALREPVTSPLTIGMLTAKSQASATVRLIPRSSPPTTIAVGPL